MKNRYIKHKLWLIHFILVGFLSVSSFAKDVLTKNHWMKLSNSSAKTAMLSGANTAIAKGYSSLYKNPAGLATNYALGLYINTNELEHQNSTGSTSKDTALATTAQEDLGTFVSAGLFYKYFMVDFKQDVHYAAGMAYGFESDYGLFSFGGSYLIDNTILTNYDTYATGNYYTLGFQWQKSFIGIDEFYAIYFGVSKKGQGVHEQIDEPIGYVVSPIVQNIGLGLETNLYSTTLLLSFDNTVQSFNNIEDTMTTNALGIQWMITNKVSLALGGSLSTYKTQLNLKENLTYSAGVELGFSTFNMAIAVLQEEISDISEVYIKNNSLHTDISFAF
jgi:hypothetical protein